MKNNLINDNMKRFMFLVGFLCLVMIAKAVPSLVVNPLSGKECITALGNIGKVVYSGDSLYVYDAMQDLVFSDLLANVRHIRFSDEQPSTPTNLENTQGNNVLQVKVYPNPTQDILMVENAQGNVLRLYTIGGQLVTIQPVNNGSAQVKMSDLPSGNYLLLSGNQSFQVIKQ
jgi:hypothetical protein